MGSRSVRAVLAPLVLLALALPAGCSGGSDDTGATAGTPAAPAARPAEGVDGQPAPQRTAEQADPALGTPAVIRHGSVELRSEDVGRSQREVRTIADRYAGDLAEQTTSTDDEGEPAHARMVLRVPTDRFEDAMAALERTAELRASNSDEDDVTTELIDLRSRLQVQRRSIARVATLLDRARRIRDVIMIEGHLARRQAALESLERRAAYLADQTSMSTITVTIERAPERAVATTDRTGFLAGLSTGWHALSTFAVALATVAGALLPWLVLLAVLGPFALLGLRAARRQRG